MFQLESAIRDWCDAIRDSGCEDEASIEELRDHLCCEIEQLQEEVAASQGFKITHHKMELYGLCASCQA